jgi:biotin carboxyl carrier protein
LDGQSVDVDTGSSSHKVRLLATDRVSVDGENTTVRGDTDRRIVQLQGRTYVLLRTPALSIEETARDRGTRGRGGTLVAPMPGRVVKVSVGLGQQVTQNQPLLVLEAMKMEHVIEAPHSGVVTELCVGVGSQLAGGERLLTIGSSDETQPVE